MRRRWSRFYVFGTVGFITSQQNVFHQRALSHWILLSGDKDNDEKLPCKLLRSFNEFVLVKGLKNYYRMWEKRRMLQEAKSGARGWLFLSAAFPLATRDQSYRHGDTEWPPHWSACWVPMSAAEAECLRLHCQETWDHWIEWGPGALLGASFLPVAYTGRASIINWEISAVISWKWGKEVTWVDQSQET